MERKKMSRRKKIMNNFNGGSEFMESVRVWGFTLVNISVMTDMTS